MGNKYNSKSDDQDQTLEDFIQIASHDLKGPLRKIMTFVQMIRDDEFGEKSSEYLKRINHNTALMEKMLKNLGDFLQATQKSLNVSSIDLTELIQEVQEDFKFELAERNAKVVVGDLPQIQGHPFLIRQLFQNLIENALKFSHSSRPLCIEIRCPSRAVNGLCEIQVVDNGIGFEEQDAEHIFKPFERLHGKSRYEGTGMGLAICRKIAERHGGSIRAQSNLNQGSEFVVALPEDVSI